MPATLLYCMIFFIIIGGVGMHIGSRKQSAAIQKQRWIKFFVYIFITILLLFSIIYRFFNVVAIFVIALTAIEFYKAFQKVYLTKKDVAITSLSIYILTGIVFLLFSFYVPLHIQLFVYVGVIVFDAFCQIAGQIYGKTKMLPLISPAKTWEGFTGGFIFCIIASIGIAVILEKPIVWGVVGGVVTAFTAFVGDVLASAFKRKAFIKDYSNWLPGQGGFLDRFDSLIFSGAAYFAIYFLAKQFIKAPASLFSSFHYFANCIESCRACGWACLAKTQW